MCIVFEEHYVFDSLLEINTFTTLIQLANYVDGIQHSITVVIKLMLT